MPDLRARGGPLSPGQRLELWDGALAAVRAYLRGQGLLEVSTPFVTPAVAVEPFIEPVPAGSGFVITSPELAMKRLVARSQRSIFQVAHVRRAGEVSARHREEFHLVEWYRVGAPIETLHGDVEALVAAVDGVAQAVLGEPYAPRAPLRWRDMPFARLFEATTGEALPGDLTGERRCLAQLRARAGMGAPGGAPLQALEARDDALGALARWSEIFSLWSDRCLDPWLARRSLAREGLHLVDFPGPLAALAERAGGVARRFESHAWGMELANGYVELRDPAAQRRRFERVNALRAAHGAAALPLDEAFLADLADPGLPPCVGVALGLDRLIMAAAGAGSLDGPDGVDPLGPREP